MTKNIGHTMIYKTGKSPVSSAVIKYSDSFFRFSSMERFVYNMSTDPSILFLMDNRCRDRIVVAFISTCVIMLNLC